MIDRVAITRLASLVLLFMCALVIAVPSVAAEDEQHWERLTEIQPYGDLEWDMSIREVLDRVEKRWPDAHLFPDATLFPKAEDRQLVTNDQSLFEVFAEAQKQQQFADVAEYDVPVSLSYTQLQIQGVTLLGQPAQMILSFRSTPALIAAHPDRIVYIETDSGKVALPMVFYQFQISCSGTTAADAEILKDSLEASLTTRFAPYRDVTKYVAPEAVAIKHGGYINGSARSQDPHQARRFNAQTNWEAWSVRGLHTFRAGYTVHQHEDTTTGFTAQLLYTQSPANYDYRAAYARYIADRRAERNQELLDISEDL